MSISAMKYNSYQSSAEEEHSLLDPAHKASSAPAGADAKKNSLFKIFAVVVLIATASIAYSAGSSLAAPGAVTNMAPTDMLSARDFPLTPGAPSDQFDLEADTADAVEADAEVAFGAAPDDAGGFVDPGPETPEEAAEEATATTEDLKKAEDEIAAFNAQLAGVSVEVYKEQEGAKAAGLSLEAFKAVKATAGIDCELKASSLSKLVDSVKACSASAEVTKSMDIPFCFGKPSDCKSNPRNTISGTVSPSITVAGEITTSEISATATQGVVVAGQFGLGAFMYVTGRVISGGDDKTGDTLRNMLGGLKSVGLNGQVSLEFETDLRTRETGFKGALKGRVEINNDIACKDILGCVLQSFVKKSDRGNKGVTKLGRLNFFLDFAIADTSAPNVWAMETGIELDASELKPKVLWLKDREGNGPRVYTKIEIDDETMLPNTVLGLSMPFTVCVEKCKTATPYMLVFEGGLETNGADLSGSVAMFGWWKEAFGIPIVHLGDLKIDLTIPIAYPPVISAIAPGGRFCFGTVSACIDGEGDHRIAGAAYLGIDFDPSSNENYIFAAISETTLGMFLAINEDASKDFPRMREAIPREILESGIYPFDDEKKCTGNQIMDFINNLDCFATISINAGKEKKIPTSVGDLKVPAGFGVSATVRFLDVNMHLKAELNPNPKTGFFNIDASLDPLSIGGGAIVISESRKVRNRGAYLIMRCAKFQCNTDMKGFMRLAPSPMMGIEGEMAMSSKPEGPLGLTTFRFNFNSVLFGAYDVLVAGMFQQPPTKMAFQLQVTSRDEFIKKLTDSVTALAATFGKALTDFKQDVAGVQGLVRSKLNSGCDAIFGKFPAISLGPLISPNIDLKKTLKINFKGPCSPVKCLKQKCSKRKCWQKCGKLFGRKVCSPKICLPKVCSPKICSPKICLPSFKTSLKIGIRVAPIMLIPKKTLPTPVKFCQDGMGMVLNAGFASIQKLLDGIKAFSDNASLLITKVLGPIHNMFSFRRFNFEVAYDIIKFSGKFVLDLEMRVGGKDFSLNIALSFNANILTTIFNEIKKAFLSGLPSFDDFNKAIEMLDDIPGQAVKVLKTKGEEVVNEAKDALTEVFHVKDIVKFAKKQFSVKTIKKQFNDICKKTVPPFIIKLTGSKWINKLCDSITGKV